MNDNFTSSVKTLLDSDLREVEVVISVDTSPYMQWKIFIPYSDLPELRNRVGDGVGVIRNKFYDLEQRYE